MRVDHKDLHHKNGFGYIDKSRNVCCMIRCFECGAENYAMAVASGQCAWCGYDANDIMSNLNLQPPKKKGRQKK